VIALQAQDSLGRSSQITTVARGNRISKVASAKLPSLIHLSPACAFFTKLRKAGTSFSVQCGCQIESRQITDAPVRSPSCHAKVVFPLPAQPRMTSRAILAGYTRTFAASRSTLNLNAAIIRTIPTARQTPAPAICRHVLLRVGQRA